jgi:sugar transferase EpsL
VRRLFDLTGASVLSVLLSPILAGLALAIRLTMGSPVFFRQQRPGYRGEPFEVYKFRTMKEAADPEGNLLPDEERLTRLGIFMRQLSLDELPQLWNILRGDMSLIGPRPTLRYQVDQYDERQRRRLEIRPGLTGWAQVQGRASLPWADRIELDVWYVEHRSPRVDVEILLRTPLALFRGTYRGATGGWR